MDVFLKGTRMDYKIKAAGKRTDQYSYEAELVNSEQNRIKLLVTKDEKHYIGIFKQNNDMKYTYQVYHDDVKHFYNDRQLVMPVDAVLMSFFTDLLNQSGDIVNGDYSVIREQTITNNWVFVPVKSIACN